MALEAHTAAQPSFTDDQWERFRDFGTRQDAAAGTWLFRAGTIDCDMLLVETGSVDILRAATADSPEAVVAHYEHKQFSGEMNLLTGQRTYLNALATSDATVYRISPSDFRRLMNSEPDLSDLILRALIDRRQILRANEAARSVEVLVGTPTASSLALRTYLERHHLPHTWTEADSELGQLLLRAAQLQPDDLPAVLTATTVVRNATPTRVANVIGLSRRPSLGTTMDVTVIGGGPAGLAAAVYGASEGLRTVLVDAIATGGQAAASSRIENYLGFTSGLSGADLTTRAVIQAQKFGARIATPAPVTAIDATGNGLTVRLDDDTAINTRTVIIATGARYKSLPLPGWSSFEGSGIYYAATELESRLCGSGRVAVIGGANSAGQAALFLASRDNHVDLVVRASTLGAGMSAYLAERIDAHPSVTVHTSTHVSAVDGDDRLRSITLSTSGSDDDQGASHDCCGLFCFIGATPATDWLTTVALDDHGFILTDARLPSYTLDANWSPDGRRPLPFETSQPAVFAAGDVRAGSMKRVAAAVGEGASAISSVHAILTAVPL
ncbi:FAD-dependent oxidoreductase [Gordonia jacobaea]|uniref:FAD-dependent oxidoreductase n=1 Tax=Gordonia jacobaea TaxID=122202 RepID=UPI003D74BF47